MQVVRWTSPSGTRRLLTVLDDAEIAHYRRVAALALPRRPPGRSSFAAGGPPGRPWHERRAAWRAAIAGATRRADAAIASDVRRCYPSIGARAIRLAASWAGGDAEPLLAFLAMTRDVAGPGLPIGPAPSAAIADAVLAIADAEAAVAGVAPIRWVDDVVFAGGRAEVARAEGAWRAALAELGLRDHEGKRRALEGSRIASTASQLARPTHVIMRSS